MFNCLFNASVIVDAESRIIEIGRWSTLIKSIID